MAMDDPTPIPPPTGDDSSLRVHLVICNIQKIANIKAMLNAAVAFGCTDVLIVGQERNSKRTDMFPPPFREAVQDSRIAVHRFAKWRECVSYLQEHEIFLVGVEIDETSQLLEDDYFERNFSSTSRRVGILMGNEGQGIQPAHLKDCQQLIRIPQYGAGTASMNVNVATNIVLYRFQKWNNHTKNKQQTAAPSKS